METEKANTETTKYQSIFKKKDEVFEASLQHTAFVYCSKDGNWRARTFDDWYELVSNICLLNHVPDKVRFHFDIAKNVLLYGWFSYEMMFVAEFTSHSVVEKSLKIIYGYENAGKKSPSYSNLFKQAVKDGLLNDSGFHVPDREIERIEYVNGNLQVSRQYLSEEDLAKSNDYVSRVAEGNPEIRNHIAHGNTFINPDAPHTLRVDSEVINMLFERA